MDRDWISYYSTQIYTLSSFAYLGGGGWYEAIITIEMFWRILPKCEYTGSIHTVKNVSRVDNTRKHSGHMRMKMNLPNNCI